jgi:hypothetical protein
MNNKNFFLVTLGIPTSVFIFVFALTFLIPPVGNARVIKPYISITSSQNSAGIKINVKGKSFSGGSMATLYAKNPDGSQAAVQNMNISKDGTFNISHLFPVGYPAGTYVLWAVDDSTGKYSNRINFSMPATKSTEVRPPPPIYSPSYTPKHGDLIRVKGDTKVYLIQGQQQGPQLNYQRRGVVSEEVFNRMGFKQNDIKDIDPQDMMMIPEGPPIWSREIIAPFPEGTLIRLKGTARTYVIQGGRKCYIPDPETFNTRGYKWDQVIEVDQTALNFIITGIPIPSVKPPYQYTPPDQQPAVQTPSPTGPAVIQPQSPSSPTPSQPYGSSTTQSATGSTPYQIQPQSSSFPDGTLVKGSGPDIYLIENGVKRLIPDMETFNAMRLNWNNITNVDDQKLANIPMGVPLTKRVRKKLGL